MDKLNFSYDKNGSGKNYGIQYTGDFKLLMKGLLWMILNKQISIPLRSHHGTTIHLVDCDLTLDLVAHGWTHANKGNGPLKLLLILKDNEWYSTINQYGNTDRKEGRMTIETKKGLLYIIEKLGYKIHKVWNHENTGNSISVVLEAEANFVNHEHEKYDETFEIFMFELKEMTEVYNTLTQTV